MARAWTTLAVVAVALALPGAARAAPLELSSGPLTARVTAEPFALEFADRADGDVLRTLSGAAAAARGQATARSATRSTCACPVVNNAYFGYEIQARGRDRLVPRHAAARRAQRRARRWCSTWRPTTRSATGSR